MQTYWLIGKHIVEFEQGGKEKADYGSQLLDQLAKDLSERSGKGFSRSNVFQIRQFHLRFSKIQTLSGQFESVENQPKLSWSHYIEILKADSDKNGARMKSLPLIWLLVPACNLRASGRSSNFSYGI